MANKEETKTIAALLMANAAIVDILEAGELTEEIRDELEYIQPFLAQYIENA